VEDIGSRISEVIDWAIAVGDAALELLGEATERLGNSISYVLNYLENDFIPGIRKFVEGALNAASAIAGLIAWVANKTFEIMREVVIGALAAGIGLATLLTEVMLHPDQTLDLFIAAARDVGNSIQDIYQSVLDTGEEFIEEVTETLREFGESIDDMLEAAFEVSAGMLGATISILFEMLGSYRNLTADEEADGRFVFGDAIDWNNTFIAKEGPLNDIVFGVQDFVTRKPESRAFVTGNLINFDVDDDFSRATLVHELTHVWQNQNVGPVYLAHAVSAQLVGAGYNYGYNEGLADVGINIPNAFFTPVGTPPTTSLLGVSEGIFTGAGGETVLNDATSIHDFNEEQQGQILMQYFVRARLLGQTGADINRFQPFVDEAKAA